MIIGKWVKDESDGLTPGGTPIYVCGRCGNTAHLFGVEFSKRKVICDACGRVNIYPWETAHEQGSTLWEEDRRADT